MGDLGIDVSIILKFVINMACGWELNSSGSRHWSVAGSCEHGNEPSGSIKGTEFLDQLSDC
jgi:hypothetical protein